LTDPVDDSGGIEFTEFARRQLNAIRVINPSLWARLGQAISDNLIVWSPGEEDKLTIKHLKTVSDDCNHNVYRFKYELHGLTERRWRVFFTLLNLRKPPVRLVLAVVDFKNEQQCYDDPTQAHRIELRKAIDEAVLQGETKKKTKWLTT
jgi:hypothetical protein